MEVEVKLAHRMAANNRPGGATAGKNSFRRPASRFNQMGFKEGDGQKGNLIER